MQDRIRRELTEMYHTSVERKYFQIISQVSFSHIFLFIFFSNSLKSFILLLFSLFLYKKILFFRMQIFVCNLIFLNSVQYSLYTLNLFTLILKKKKYKIKLYCILFDKRVLLILILHWIWFKVIEVNYIFHKLTNPEKTHTHFLSTLQLFLVYYS